MWLEEVAASESEYSGKDKFTGKRQVCQMLAPNCFRYYFPEFTVQREGTWRQQGAQSFTKLFNNHSKLLFNFETPNDPTGRLYLQAVDSGPLISWGLASMGKSLATLGKSLKEVGRRKHKVGGTWIRK